jgi:2-polyprenyl-6-methoxyphenol hydroxylase-like FAD-dependent oxidoreductase
MLDRNDYWQCGYLISKGDFDKIKQRGLSLFCDELSEIVPFLKNHTEELKDWNQVNLLSVAIDHLEKWYCDGLLCIGDAAHAMSPIGGVGINLAIQDAVATANILYKPLLERKSVETTELRKVQKRREFPTKFTQRLQINVQKGIISRRLENQRQKKPPFIMRMLNLWPYLRRIPARFVGIGIRPEHIHTPIAKD